MRKCLGRCGGAAESQGLQNGRKINILNERQAIILCPQQF